MWYHRLSNSRSVSEEDVSDTRDFELLSISDSSSQKIAADALKSNFHGKLITNSRRNIKFYPTINSSLLSLSQNRNTYATVPEISITDPKPWTQKLAVRVLSIVGILMSLSTLILLYTSNSANRKHNNIHLGAVLARTTSYKPVIHPDSPTTFWGPNIAKPYPTGAFWTNFVVKSGDGAVAVTPYAVKALDSGVQVSYSASHRIVTPLAITDVFMSDLQISSVESYVSRCVDRFDNISVTLKYTVSSPVSPPPTTFLPSPSPPIKPITFKVPLVKGSPFITVVYDGSTPVISSPRGILSVDARVVRGSTGVQYLVQLANFQRWLVYCSEPIVLKWTDDTLTAPAPIHGIIRIAILPAQNVEASFNMYLNYVNKYPIGCNVSISYPSATQAVVEYKFLTVGTGSLLMLNLPHHTQLFTLPVDDDEQRKVRSAITPLFSMKGSLRAIVGDVWHLIYALKPIGWTYPLSRPLTTPQLDEIAKNLLIDVASAPPTAPDPYTFGKQIGRMAQLALIADSLGISDARQQAMTTLTSTLTPWLTGTNPNALVYDKVYGGIISTNGVSDPNADYGNGYYNDHHFHYGYFVFAFAVIAKLDASFLEANRGQMETFIRDICNPDPTDPDFPFARHKDFFDGHSWASGLFQQANGKGQESSSEAANAYYGTYLYALATSNAELQKFAHLMLMMEIQAVQWYWHMPNEAVYDSVFSASRMVGNVGALDVTVSTWFGNQLAYVHGINLMPVTAVTGLLFEPSYVSKEWQVLGPLLPPVGGAGDEGGDAGNGGHAFKQMCSANAQCASMNLEGLCCPTATGEFLACCDSSPSSSLPSGGLSDEWKSLLYILHAVIDREAAWKEISMVGGFGTGGSRTNALMWAGSRVPFIDANITSAGQVDKSMKVECAANSACMAIGMEGLCCPTATGVMLGCCPKMEP